MEVYQHSVMYEINAQREKQSGIKKRKGALLRDVKQRPTANQVKSSQVILNANKSFPHRWQRSRSQITAIYLWVISSLMK